LPDFGQKSCDPISGDAWLAPMASDWDDLADHVVRTTGLPAPAARRVVEDVAAFFGETADEYVRRRHRELQAAGRANPEIFATVAAELAARPVRGPQLSERQVRRVIYG
jgi:hypothetical protein